MKNHLLLLLWLIAATYCYGQPARDARYSLVGWVFDEHGKPVPYASVGLVQLHVGTSTNMAGGFLVRLKAGSLLVTDTLVISCLGYKSYKRAMADISDTLIVTLKSHSYTMDEIIVTNLTAGEVVAEMFKMKRKNYPRKKFKTEGFFRGLIRNDSTYVMMTEAVVSMVDKGYRKLGDTKAYLQELKYIDEREFDSLDVNYDTLTETNEVYRLWELDYMNWSFDRVDIFPVKRSLKYRLDSITYFDDDPVYCISVLNGSSWFYNQIFIRMDDFALLEARRGIYLESYVKKTASIFNKGHAVDDRHLRVEVVQYRPYGGKWYLYYASLTESLIGGDKQKVRRLANARAQAQGSAEVDYTGIEYNGRLLDPEKNNYFRQTELLITRILPKKEKVKKGKLMDPRHYVYRNPVPYNQAFWQHYRQLQLNPNLKRARQHLSQAEILNATDN